MERHDVEFTVACENAERGTGKFFLRFGGGLFSGAAQMGFLSVSGVLEVILIASL